MESTVVEEHTTATGGDDNASLLEHKQLEPRSFVRDNNHTSWIARPRPNFECRGRVTEPSTHADHSSRGWLKQRRQHQHQHHRRRSESSTAGTGRGWNE